MESMLMGHVVLKCRKCRKIILEHPRNTIVSAHGSRVVENKKECLSLTESTLWYVVDDTVPSWISLALEKDNWTRGKLSCPNCSARLGSFDFVSGSKCSCREYIVPSVHIIKGKVDVSPVQVSQVDLNDDR